MSRDFQTGDRMRVVLNAEVIAVSLDREWLLLTPESRCKIWVPVDEFVDLILPEAVEQQGNEMNEPQMVHLHNDKPITHTVIVTEPIQIHRWATSEELAEKKAQEYREKGYTVRIEKGAK